MNTSKKLAFSLLVGMQVLSMAAQEGEREQAVVESAHRLTEIRSESASSEHMRAEEVSSPTAEDRAPDEKKQSLWKKTSHKIKAKWAAAVSWAKHLFKRK
jgi:hypothetical protein